MALQSGADGNAQLGETGDVNAELQAVYAEAAACEALLAELEADKKETGVTADSGIVASSSVNSTLSRDSGIDEDDDDTEGSESEEHVLDEGDTFLEDTGVVTAGWLDDEEAKLMFGEVVTPASKATNDAPLRFEILPPPQGNARVSDPQDKHPLGKADVGGSLRVDLLPYGKPIEEDPRAAHTTSGGSELVARRAQPLVQCASSSEASSEEESSSEEAEAAHPEVQLQDFKEVSGPVIFSLLLDRSSGARLGVDIETGRESAGWDGRTLLIRGVQEDGLVKAWNEAYPGKAVFPGDRICAVNNVSGDAKVLITECCKKKVLELTLTRELPPMQSNEESSKPKASDADTAGQQLAHRRPPRPSVANDEKVAKLKQDVADAASAAAVVKLLRSELQHSWAASWGAEALLKIADRSTEQTREAWVKDPIVVELADSLMREAGLTGMITPAGEELETVLVAMESLRRMHLQEVDKQRAAVQRCIDRAAAEKWEFPVKVLARLLWLAAPFKTCTLTPVEERLRQHYNKLDAADFFHIVDGLRCRQRYVLLEESSRLKSGRLLIDTLPTLRDFRLSFDLVPHETSDDPSSILRLADKGQDVLFSRNCLPAFCLLPKSTQLIVFLGPQGKPVAKYTSPPPGLQTGQPARVTVTLTREVFTVYLNGKEVELMPASGATSQRTDAKTEVWAGDTIYEAASASVGNLALFISDEWKSSESKLLHKVALRLQEEKFCASIPTAHMVPLIETLDELGMRNKRALQILGQEILQRKPEFSPDDLRRLEIAFDQCKLPLNTVWAALGASKKRKGGQLVTSQVFAPQQGHDKKHRSEQDIERTSPERYVADHVQSSY